MQIKKRYKLVVESEPWIFYIVDTLNDNLKVCECSTIKEAKDAIEYMNRMFFSRQRVGL